MAKKSGAGCDSTSATARACQSRKAVFQADKGWAAPARSDFFCAKSCPRCRTMGYDPSEAMMNRGRHCSDLAQRCKSRMQKLLPLLSERSGRHKDFLMAAFMTVSRLRLLQLPEGRYLALI